MDAFGAPDECTWKRTVKSCCPDAPTLASSRPRCFASWPATVARKPGSPGRPRSKPLKPLRGECRNVSADLWWTCSCAFFTCTRGYGCGERPAFPAPSANSGEGFCASPGRTRRGKAEVRHCEEHERRRNPIKYYVLDRFAYARDDGLKSDTPTPVFASLKPTSSASFARLDSQGEG
jgi:hypothetical protein